MFASIGTIVMAFVSSLASSIGALRWWWQQTAAVPPPPPVHAVVCCCCVRVHGAVGGGTTITAWPVEAAFIQKMGSPSADPHIQIFKWTI